MTSSRAVLGLLLVAFGGAAAGAQEEGVGIVGWRGDGTGKYPNAAPPTSWSRSSRPMRELRCQAGRPAAADRGTPMTDGVLREWLVLAPAPPGSKVDREILPGEADLAPAENEKAGEATWKKVVVDTAWLDFSQLISRTDQGIAVAATNLYSETGGTFRVHATQLGAFRILLNGKPLPAGYGRYQFTLVKGWNRLLIKVAPHPTGWACTLTLHARSPEEPESSNIAWSAELPGIHGGFYGGGTGCASPLIIGDRIYLTSEPHDLICLSKETGKVLWVKTNSFCDAATAEDRKHPGYAEADAVARQLDTINDAIRTGPLTPKQLDEKVRLEKVLSGKMQDLDPVRYRKGETPDIGFAGYAPVFDGKRIYLWMGSGVTACYDPDGTRLWIRADPMPPVEHGFTSSPLLVDGKVVVFMRDLFAFHAASGDLAWRIPVVSHEGANPGGYFHGTPLRVTRGGVALIVLGNGTIVRASDGKILSTHPEMGNQAISSPVVDGDRLFETGTSSMKLFIHTLPDAVTGPFKMPTVAVPLASPAFPWYYMPWHMASPLVHEGLAYLLNNSGVLSVVDVAAGTLVYQKMLDLDQFQTANEGAARGIGISPALAGNRLYFFGNNGAAVVLEPGRTFKQVAKNKIENLVAIGHWSERQERFVSNPVFDAGRLYIRGEGHLYAIAAGATLAEQPAPRPEPLPASPSKAPVPAPTPVVPQPPEAEAAPSPVFGWRLNGSGVFPGASPPTEWSAEKNIRWKASVGRGNASPVISGDRVIVVSEPGVLLCLRRTDGRELWKADLKSDLPPPPNAPELARPTPVTDGRSVYVSLGNGLVVSYSLEGKRNWAQVVDPPTLTYGPSASPVLAGDRLLVEGRRLTALDAATGRLLWKAAEGEPHYGTPLILTLGGTPFAVTAKGLVVRLSDGVVAARNLATGLGGDQAPSPVAQGAVVYFAYRRCSAVKLSLTGGQVKAETVWEQELPGDVIASPVLKDGMLFVVPSGSPELRVLNAATGAVLLEKDLDLSINLYPSLALAGKHLYVGNDKGDMLVLEPTRECKGIRHNELPDGSGASPVFSGTELFLRAGGHLYCIAP